MLYNKHRLLVFVLFAILFNETASAARFRRISFSAELATDTATYVIGSVDKEGKFYLMSSNLDKKKKKLNSVPFSSKLSETIEVEDTSLYWSIKRGKRGVSLVSSEGKYLLPGKSSTDVQFYTSPESFWTIEVTDSCSFIFGSGDHFLAFTESTPECFVFGNYSKNTQQGNRPLYIFKKECGDNLGTDTAVIHRNDGVLQLSGKWSSEQLADIDWAECSELDLTGIVIPDGVTDFLHRPSDRVTCIYVSDNQISKVPAFWSFIVSVGFNQTTLIDSVTIPKDIPMVIKRSFDVPEGLLTYKRQLQSDGCCETLCLPFAAHVPHGCKVWAMSGMNSSADSLYFERVYEVEPNKPYLLEPDASLKGKTLEFVSTSCTVKPLSVSTLSTFYPCFNNMKVNDVNHQQLYFLKSSNIFCRAGKGSSLSPFRAYLNK